MNTSKEEYRHLLLLDYPEAFEPNGFVSWTRSYFEYIDVHPEQWKELPMWVEEAWNQDPEMAVLKYAYEFLRSFA